MTESALNTLAVSCVGIFLTFLASLFFFQKQQAIKAAETLAVAHKELLERVGVLEKKEAVAAAQFVPIASAFQATLIKLLTHAHTGELDALLVKVADHTLTPEEEPRMLALLDERTRDMDERITEEDREIAGIFPTVAKLARKEQLLLLAARDTVLQPSSYVPVIAGYAPPAET